MASRPSPDVIYAELSAEDNSTEIESLCTQCWENGKTRIMLTKIPYFKEVILMSFSCPHCGFNNNEIQPGAPLQDKGCRIELKVERAEDLNRQIIKSEHATFKILENEFEIPPTTQRGISSTTEGMIAQAAANLEKDQPVRQHIDLDTTGKIQGVIDTLKAMAAGQQLPFTVVLDDPAGNSFIESIGTSDTRLSKTLYERTREQLQEMGYNVPQANDTHTAATAAPPPPKHGADLPDHLRAANWDFSKSIEDNIDKRREEEESGNIGRDEALFFEVDCHHCGTKGRQDMCAIDIPGFRECLVMAFNCPHCGVRNNEVKAAGAIGDKARRWTLRVTDPEDLNRDVLKSDSAAVRIPEIDFEMQQGTQGSAFTTVEGLIGKIADHLQESNPFTGDSSAQNELSAFTQTIDDLRKLCSDPSCLPFTLVLDDAADHSFIGRRHPERPQEDDPGLTSEAYDRTEAQNDELGLLQMKTEGYEHEQPP